MANSRGATESPKGTPFREEQLGVTPERSPLSELHQEIARFNDAMQGAMPGCSILPPLQLCVWHGRLQLLLGAPDSPHSEAVTYVAFLPHLTHSSW
jgi:hypothetical protein